MTEQAFRGVFVPVLTPFTEDLKPDTGRFVDFCRALLAQGADGLAVFGTTSEANSLSGDERMALLDALIEAGIPGARLMPGTGACSFVESARLTRHAVEHGCGGVLMLPPFYYKGMSDDGLYDHFARVIDGVVSDALRIYLYHIPPVAQVGFSLDLIGRLIADFPATVVGIKDSSGDWSNTEAMLDAFPDFSIFPGSEVFLLPALRKGGAGCITATGNVNVPGIRAIYESWQADDGQADALQEAATALRKRIQAHPMVPALKAIVARHAGDEGWRRVRPPMRSLAQDAAAQLYASLDESGFAMATSAEAAA